MDPALSSSPKLAGSPPRTRIGRAGRSRSASRPCAQCSPGSASTPRTRPRRSPPHNAAGWRRVLPPAVVVRQGSPRPLAMRTPAAAAVRAEIRMAPATRSRSPRWLPAPSTSRRDRRACRAAAADPGRAAARRSPAARLRRRAAGGRRAAHRGPGPAAATRAGPRLGAGWSSSIAVRRIVGDGRLTPTLPRSPAGRVSRAPALLLVNPLHAAAPSLPQQNSPYFPASRRFSSPIYLRPEQLPEYAAADPADSAPRSTAGGRRARSASASTGTRSGPRSLAALELLFPFRVPAAGRRRQPGARLLRDVVRACRAAGADWHEWPAELQRPERPRGRGGARAGRRPGRVSPLAAALLRRAARRRAAGRQRRAAWPSASCTTWPSGSTRAARTRWALQRRAGSTAFSVGAPPDSFNQQGQNWGLPPWRPDRLADTGFAPVREMVRRSLRGGGGLRIDHILGLFRLWWVPSGAARGGRHVRVIRRRALLGILALEAERAGALVVGEDLGTVAADRSRHADPPARCSVRRCSGSSGTTDDTLVPPPTAGARWPSRPPPRTICRPPPAFSPASTSGSVPSWAADRSARPKRRRRRASGQRRHCSTGWLAERVRWPPSPPMRGCQIVALHALLAREPVAGAAGPARRRRRRSAPAQLAGNRRRVPELAAAGGRRLTAGCCRGRSCAPRPGAAPAGEGAAGRARAAASVTKSHGKAGIA